MELSLEIMSTGGIHGEEWSHAHLQHSQFGSPDFPTQRCMALKEESFKGPEDRWSSQTIHSTCKKNYSTTLHYIYEIHTLSYLSKKPGTHDLGSLSNVLASSNMYCITIVWCATLSISACFYKRQVTLYLVFIDSLHTCRAL